MPLTIHVPAMAPIRKSISMADPTERILSSTESSSVCHEVPYTAMEMATMTADATMSATWLPPARESAPKTLMTATRTAINTMNGTVDTTHDGRRTALFDKMSSCCPWITFDMRSRASDTPASSTFLFLNGNSAILPSVRFYCFPISISLIDMFLPEFIALKMGPDIRKKPYHPCRIDGKCSPESTVIPEMFGQHAPEEDPEPHAGIP